MSSRLLDETRQIADKVQLALDAHSHLQIQRPAHLYTLARGSSDHAAAVIQRFIASAGIPATSLPPGMVSPLMRFPDSAVVAISQSGASPDLLQASAHCRAAGCDLIAVLNTVKSPLAANATVCLDQCAGTEQAVAATKSVVCSIVVGARLAQSWGGDVGQLDRLAERIQLAQQQSIEALVKLLIAPGPLLVIGRGSGLGIAQEIALKIQELLARPAMAYSSAEVLHGPAGMIRPGYPVLALAVGEQRDAVLHSVHKLATLGAQVLQLDDIDNYADALSATVALSQVYLALEQACRELGRSPDLPTNLQKITLTD